MFVTTKKLLQSILCICIQTFPMNFVPEKIILDAVPINLRHEETDQFSFAPESGNDRKPLAIPSKPTKIEDLPKLSLQKNCKRAVDKRLLRVKKMDDHYALAMSLKQKPQREKSDYHRCMLCEKLFNSKAAFEKHRNYCSKIGAIVRKQPLINVYINRNRTTLLQQTELAIQILAKMKAEANRLLTAQSSLLREPLQS